MLRTLPPPPPPPIIVNLLQGNFWNDPQNRRLFFENFARSKGFDPLQASRWYSVTIADLAGVKVNINSHVLYSQFQGATTVLRHYNKSIPAALMDVFPDIGLEKKKFQSSYSINPHCFCLNVL